MSEEELETEFKKINLEAGTSKPVEAGATKCDCKRIFVKPLETFSTSNSLKVIDKRRNLIKPARLKMIGTCWTRNSKSSSDEATEENLTASVDLDTFASEHFLKMRITQETPSHSPLHNAEEKEERTSPVSQPNSCSAQAKLKQQFCSSEFDSTIDEMADAISYHLNLYNHEKNFLVDSMYT